MITFFPKATTYLQGLDQHAADPLDQKAYELLMDDAAYERASQALRRRFVRGAEKVNGIDRKSRPTHIKRVKDGGLYRYYINGENGTWSEPDERIWVVAMYALWQDNK